MKPIEAYDILLKAVVENIGLHKGGPEYFTAFDKWVRDSGHLMDFVSLLLPLKAEDMNVIVSGKFGRAFMNMCYNQGIKFNRLIVVNGDLRNQKTRVENLHYMGRIDGVDFHFIDDSYYSGKTQRQVKLALRYAGAELVQTLVVYDGASLKHNNVKALFRYYDWDARP